MEDAFWIASGRSDAAYCNPNPDDPNYVAHCDAGDALSKISLRLRDAIECGCVLVFDEPAAQPDTAKAAPSNGAPQFPAHCLNVSGVIGIACRWLGTTAIVRQPFLDLGSTLAVLGALFGRRYELEGYGTRTNMLAIGVAPTGGGKDHARKQWKAALAAAGLSDYVMGMVTGPAAMLDRLAENPGESLFGMRSG